MKLEELGRILRRLRETAGSDLGLARVLGLRASNHVPRLLDLRVLPSVGTCLHIAQASGHPPNEILEVAGHADVIPILEASYRGDERLRLGKDALADFRRVRLLTAPLVAGKPVKMNGPAADALAFREPVVQGLIDPVALRLGPREDAMAPTIQPGDAVLINQSIPKRLHPSASRIYLLNLPEDADLPGGMLRRVKAVRGGLILGAINPTYPFLTVDLGDRGLADLILGECVWLGRAFRAD